MSWPYTCYTGGHINYLPNWVTFESEREAIHDTRPAGQIEAEWDSSGSLLRVAPMTVNTHNERLSLWFVNGSHKLEKVFSKSFLILK
jgi:hypothetical protein